MTATMTDKWIIRRTLGPVPIKGYGPGATITATVGLHHLGSNDHPHWTATAEIVTPRSRCRNDIEAGGCLHDEILAQWPELAPVVALHLADNAGMPMHGAANAVYFAGRSKRFAPRDGESAYYEPNEDALVSTLRISPEQARWLINEAPSRAAIESFVADQATRYQEESDAAMALLRGL
jgi:hypothetical protein